MQMSLMRLARTDQSQSQSQEKMEGKNVAKNRVFQVFKNWEEERDVF
jgi:hypothetical protein